MGGMVPGPITPHDKLQRRSARQFVSTEDRQTSQTHMMLGCQAFGYNHPDEVAARAVTTILGQGPSSRLHVEIRERQALAYDVSSDYSPFTDSGMLEIYAGVNNDKTEQAVEALLGEVDRMRQGSVEKNELLKAKNQLRGALQMSLESNSNVADRLGSQLLLLGKIKSLEELLAEIDAVTVEDVNRVAAELLQPERLRLAVIGSAPEKVKSKFEEIVGKHVKSEV
jgi:predicted Zn-dependent peptidase